VRWLIGCGLLIAVGAGGAPAQDSRHPGRAGPRTLLTPEREIALARSAAPASIADSAAVYVFSDSGYVLAVPSRNGAACYVSRSWPGSLEPHCFDREGSASVMRIHMREVELLHRGLTPEQAERELGPELAAGRLRLPRVPALSWMFSAEQQLIGDDGRPAGRWRPHIMIYYPYLEPVPTRTPDPAAGMVSGAGTPQSSLLIVVPEFVPVRPLPQ